MITINKKINPSILVGFICCLCIPTLTSCNKLKSQVHHTMQVSTSETSSDGSYNPYPIAIPPERPLFGVVLLHGLNMSADELEDIERTLHNTYKHHILILNPKLRSGWESVRMSIEKQAKSIYDYINNTLNQHSKLLLSLGAGSLDARSFPLFIIGNSQGGLLTCIFTDTYKAHLNLCGFVSHHGTLRGTEVLKSNPLHMQKFQTHAQQGLAIIGAKNKLQGIGYSIGLKWMRDYVCPLLDYINCKPLEGVRDILPDSRCSQSAYQFLRNPNPAIPGLLIGGYENDFNKLFKATIEQYKETYPYRSHEVDHAIQTLNKAAAVLITGKEEELHDQLLSLKNQIGRGDSLEDLTQIGLRDLEELEDLGNVEAKDNLEDVIQKQGGYAVSMPGNPHVTCIVLKGVTHCGNLFPIDPSLFIESSAIENRETMMSPKRMLPILIKFIDEQLENKNLYIHPGPKWSNDR